MRDYYFSPQGRDSDGPEHDWCTCCLPSKALLPAQADRTEFFPREIKLLSVKGYFVKSYFYIETFQVKKVISNIQKIKKRL